MAPSTSAALPQRHERADVLAWGTGPVRPTPRATIGRLFEAVSRRHASTVAVSDGMQAFTYEELNRAADLLAARLRQDGAGPGTFVSVSVPRGPEMVVALLGVLKSGAAYVPVDPELPPARREFLIADSGAKLSVSSRDQLADVGVATAESTEPADTPIGPSDLAYVIYTSGSTGTPKGVCVEHGSVVDFAVHNADAYGVGPGTRMLALASLGFDVSVAEIFTALLTGATVIVAGNEERTDPARLQRTLREQRINVAELPPALLGLLDPDSLPDLELVSVGGEAPSASEVRRWIAAGHRVVNAYGPTETTVSATLMECDASERTTIPIGVPMANHRVYVLDGDRTPVTPGVEGELWIAGAGVARGYLGRPELTAERFVTDPFTTEPGARMYRTGDRVRWNDDGTLEFLGRVDEQLNVNGYRIEPGEIEARLTTHPGVAAAAVTVRDDGAGARLVAYVVPRTRDLRAAAGELATWCAAALPGALVPRAYVQLDALPLTVNGKTDRAALPAPATNAAASSRAAALPLVTAPRTATQEAILKLWQELLPGRSISCTDDFFELGGHSLLAMRLLSRLRKRFEIELSITVLHNARTVETLAAAVDAAPPANHYPSPDAPDNDAQLSYAQQRLWLVDRLGTDPGAYNVPVVQRLRGALDTQALNQALTDVAARHEELRVSFPAREGQPHRQVHEPRATTIPCTDLATRAPGETSCEELVAEAATRPFDLATGPLWRARLIRLADDDHVLVIVIHHIVCDGWSLTVLLDELGARYNAHHAGHPLALEPLPATYAEFAGRQRARLKGPALKKSLDFWREELAGARTVLELPADRERPPVQSYAAARRTAAISETTTAGVKALAADHGETVFAVLLAAFHSLLGRLAGNDDVIVACPVAGRPEPELESVIGFFIDMVAVRAQLPPTATFSDLLTQVGGRLRKALAHQSVPFEMVVDAVRPVRDLSRNPLAQVALNFHSYPDDRLSLDGVAVEEHPVGPSGSLFDLTVHVREVATGLELEAVYRRDLYAAERIDELLAQYVHLLAQVASSPEAQANFHTLRPPHSHAQLPDPQQTLSTAATATAAARFAAQAARTPERTAVVGSDRTTLTYRELQDRVNALAGQLTSAGIDKGDRIAIRAGRDEQLVTDLLGTLSAGATAVLIDRELPRTRRAALLDRVEPCRELDSRVRNGAGTGHPGGQVAGRGAGGAGAPLAPGLDDPAYVLFTSGSTGTPKPVLASHRPIAHFLDWYLEAFEIDAEDRFAVLSGVGHDPVLRDLLPALCTGASVHIPENGIQRDGVRLLQWLDQHAITVIHITPQLGRMLAGVASELGAPPLSALRVIAFGGDTIREDDVARWRELAPNATLASFYGATETPQVMGCALLNGPAQSGSRRPLPLGVGIDDVQLLVLNAAGQPAGLGEHGEIWVRTPHLAHGYLSLSDEVATASNFTTGAHGDRRYRTGDLGRHLLDGRIEFLGRRDGQVKVRGFRVEPAEVTAALSSLPGVTAAHVTGAEAPGGERRLVAHVAGAGLDPEEIQLALRAVLPGHMVPEQVVVLGEPPLTANGKLDTAALTCGAARPATSEGYRPPTTETERLVAGIWRAVLSAGAIGRDDNFFDVGGNSMRLAQVQARLTAGLGHELAMVDLFRYPTIRTLCAFLERGAQHSQAVSRAPRRVNARRELRARRVSGRR